MQHHWRTRGFPFRVVPFFICSCTVSWSTVQCWYYSPLRGETGRLHLWPTWFDFVECVPSLQPRPGQLLISPLLLFIMSEWLNKRGGKRETGVRIKGGRGRLGVREPNQAYHKGPVWERQRERDGFIMPGISACDCKSGVTFPVSPLSSHSFSVTLFCLPLSSAGACSAKSLGSLAGISMNQSLLSSHIYEGVSGAKPQRLMRLMWVSSSASGKALAFSGGDQHEPLWRVRAPTSFITTQ